MSKKTEKMNIVRLTDNEIAFIFELISCYIASLPEHQKVAAKKIRTLANKILTQASKNRGGL